MARPQTKEDLLKAIDLEFGKLTALLDTLDENQFQQAGVCGEWSAKDILAHLHAWGQMVLKWYRTGVRGEPVKTPAEDLKWSQLPILNQRIYEQYRAVPLDYIQSLFNATHKEMLATINAIPETDLVTPDAFSWTNETTLLSYFVSCTASHYHWATDKIRRWVKDKLETA